MNIEQVLEMWKKDSIIDDLKLDDTTVKMARIHSKYLELVTIAKMSKKKKDLEYKTLLKISGYIIMVSYLKKRLIHLVGSMTRSKD